ncbi:hypothetical protein EBB79_22155 (plasmid) [Parasedimentitalea marina]|uniref:Uncharacterized protein n=1 Tax=Parasedimentitalea marina TaxID=2483033 RepID=A0A3T0N9J8_9RHOB|nr:hypothetical protein [Parasedimentitalea marina]AZV80661.1 hypothetical protein EBB79_22155 [Parasedimentitalea marina]
MSAAPTSRPSKAAPDFILLGGPLAASHQVVLVPGEMVPLYSLDLPASLRSGIREKVARRQLADRLGFAPALRPFVPTIQGHPKANTKTGPGSSPQIRPGSKASVPFQGARSYQTICPSPLPPISGPWPVPPRTVSKPALVQVTVSVRISH